MNTHEINELLKLAQTISQNPDLREDLKAAALQELYVGVPKFLLGQTRPALLAVLDATFNATPISNKTTEEKHERTARAPRAKATAKEAGPQHQPQDGEA